MSLELLSMMIAGGLLGAGVLFAVRGATTADIPLARFAEDLQRPIIEVQAGRSFVGRTRSEILRSSAKRHSVELMLVERTPERFLRERLMWSGLVAVIPMMMLPVAMFVTSWAAPIWIVAAVLAGAVVGWCWAPLDLRRDAEEARGEISHALAVYLELVSILISGGAGVETALYEAAGQGNGRGFRHLRAALAASHARQEAPWESIHNLGVRLKVNGLVELSSAMTLAGGGSRVASTLQAKAESLRHRDLTALKAEAEARSEALVLPVLLMFVGFLMLIGYPAMAGLMESVG